MELVAGGYDMEFGETSRKGIPGISGLPVTEDSSDSLIADNESFDYIF